MSDQGFVNQQQQKIVSDGHSQIGVRGWSFPLLAYDE
jgi:hypothetical protein